ncbi:UDP-glucoronosyl and UDP-glucosyl transferase [Oesophagostomum dentatum]|uniref:UDP-glucuronosyltransferase n=1 Tax=Oesophagostomum dentatum TaxID=61180 RepID=A0A0B1TG10_OESDE|nr:UDP-glucoronosyl and UDP-glucosyl transferase [Oesophagostomum dentatum]
MGAIADILTEAGHNVTLLLPTLLVNEDGADATGVQLTKHIIRVPSDPRIKELMVHKDAVLSQFWTAEPSIFGLMQMTQNMTTSFTYMCEGLLNNEQLLKQLEEEKFDVGIAEPMNVCGFGIFELAKIKAAIGVLSVVHLDTVSTAIGEPVIPSYVPGPYSKYGDGMGFIERAKNLLGVVLGQTTFVKVYHSETEAFRKKFGTHFKGYEQLLAETSYIMTNSNPYLDYPRPMLHKTVPIGGVAVSTDLKRNVLPPEFDAILNERSSTVLVSFGSMAKGIHMPPEYINSLLSVFGSMPETTFIMKYEDKSSKIADHLPNVHLISWFPQNALLADPRLKAFITHGGLGSTTELAHQGKPAILIPLFGDQSRNAIMLAKHGGCIVLKKYDLAHPEILRRSLLSVLKDESYARNAKRLSEMLLSQPVSAKQLLIRHCEFTAKFGRMPNLDPYGRQLSFVQYYLIDVALAVISIFIAVICICILVVRRCCSAIVKSKKD